MDRDRIVVEWHDFFKSEAHKAIAINFAEHIAAIARNEALEEAATLIDCLPFIDYAVAKKNPRL